MSYTNYLDADAAWQVVSDFSEPAVTVIKHTNPCGLAVHPDQPTAYQRAFEGDSISAYGGIVGFNRPVTGATARAMRGVLYDIIVAPGYDADALDVLRRRRRTRILRIDPERGQATHLDLRLVTGGALVQTTDYLDEDPSAWKVVTELSPTAEQLRDLAFAWKAAKHVKFQHHSSRQRPHARRHGSRPAQPRNQRPPRPANRRRQGQRLGHGVRRLLPVPRQHRDGSRRRPYPP